MPETEKQNESINIGSAFLNDIYAEPRLINENPQPFYIVHKDTCKAFFYEIKDKFSLFDRFLSVLGVEFTLIITLITATFSDFQIIKGDTIRGIFIAFALLVGFYLLYLGFKNIANINKMSVNKLCNELGKLSTIIEPGKKVKIEDANNIIK